MLKLTRQARMGDWPIQRKFPRHPQRCGVSYGQNPAELHTGTTDNVSCEGLFVVALEPMAIGTRLSINITIGESDVALVGTVRWRRPDPHGAMGPGPNGFGVQITRAPDAWLQFAAGLVG